ncbi:hypothetical protein [Prescottella equi]|uniref:hypothetical protein n=1 Tax=Rhodococcus hoagii TaxID=43767 RepID=UPI0012F8AE9B|nr:hypothetical protein [Prescottella equi]
MPTHLKNERPEYRSGRSVDPAVSLPYRIHAIRLLNRVGWPVLSVQTCCVTVEVRLVLGVGSGCDRSVMSCLLGPFKSHLTHPAASEHGS